MDSRRRYGRTAVNVGFRLARRNCTRLLRNYNEGGRCTIGVCRVDTGKGERALTQRYALNDAEGVDRLLRDIHALRERRFRAGDYAACDLLIDLESAVALANLTDRQREVIDLIYEKDLRQQEVADALGIAQQVVQQHAVGALKRIARIFAEWDYGEIDVAMEYAGDGENSEREAVTV